MLIADEHVEQETNPDNRITAGLEIKRERDEDDDEVPDNFKIPRTTVNTREDEIILAVKNALVKLESGEEPIKREFAEIHVLNENNADVKPEDESVPVKKEPLNPLAGLKPMQTTYKDTGYGYFPSDMVDNVDLVRFCICDSI